MGLKFCRHRDSMSCGIACLQMICRHYGHNIDQYSLSNLCVPTSEGGSLFSLIKTATQLGFNATSIRISINHFNSESLPCILHWNQNHFVVLTHRCYESFLGKECVCNHRSGYAL